MVKHNFKSPHQPEPEIRPLFHVRSHLSIPFAIFRRTWLHALSFLRFVQSFSSSLFLDYSNNNITWLWKFPFIRRVGEGRIAATKRRKTLQSVNSSSRAINENWLSCLLGPNSTIVSARSQPLVTVISFAGPFLPGKLDICDIPNEKTRDLTINLTCKIDLTCLKNWLQVSTARLS